jgi:hypothetical protein
MGWFARYYFPSIPFLVLVFYVVIEDFYSNRNVLFNKSFICRIFAVLLLFAIVFIPSVGREAACTWEKYAVETYIYAPDTRYETVSSIELPSPGWWEGMQIMSTIIGRLPPKVVLAATEYGFIGAENPEIEIIDMAGLHDLDLAISGFSSDYVLSRKPDMIWFPHSDYTYFVSELIDNSSFFIEYDFYPHVLNYGIAIRKNSKFTRMITEEVRAEFTRIYPGRALVDYKAIPAAP